MSAIKKFNEIVELVVDQHKRRASQEALKSFEVKRYSKAKLVIVEKHFEWGQELHIDLKTKFWQVFQAVRMIAFQDQIIWFNVKNGEAEEACTGSRFYDNEITAEAVGNLKFPLAEEAANFIRKDGGRYELVVTKKKSYGETDNRDIWMQRINVVGTDDRTVLEVYITDKVRAVVVRPVAKGYSVQRESTRLWDNGTLTPFEKWALWGERR